ncbi:hypothetical protein [Foetidibacter luteolus]|uniref:hypothetical protein n=1 Tax=Foetidibacter luteolus TaxID=2608880 RepID=UPI00129A9234|nr:hypothetical protein [Foetidibacter luteolus]
MAELKANLDKYHGKWIATEGIYYTGFEQSALGLKDGAKAGEIFPSLWINLDSKLPCLRNIEQFNETYIRLKGRVNIKAKGHMGGYAATIENVFYIERL